MRQFSIPDHTGAPRAQPLQIRLRRGVHTAHLAEIDFQRDTLLLEGVPTRALQSPEIPSGQPTIERDSIAISSVGDGDSGHSSWDKKATSAPGTGTIGPDLALERSGGNELREPVEISEPVATYRQWNTGGMSPVNQSPEQVSRSHVVFFVSS